MTAKLFCKTGELKGATFLIADEATIGRHLNNEIPISSATISGQHARVFYDPDRGNYFLEDLESRNGTRLDGVRVRRTERLGNLHVITLAEKHDFIFQRVEQVPLEELRPTDPLVEAPAIPTEATVEGEGPDFATPSFTRDSGEDSDRTIQRGSPEMVVPELESRTDDLVDQTTRDAGGLAPVPEFAKDLGEIAQDEPANDTVPPEPAAHESAREATGARMHSTIALHLTDSTEGPEHYELREGDNFVGRGLTCQVRINNATLSRKHALLSVTPTKVTVKDLNSLNGTFVDDARIEDEVELTRHSELLFGDVAARLVWE